MGSAVSQDVFEGLSFLESCGSMWRVSDPWAWFPMKIVLWHLCRVHITLSPTPASTFLPRVRHSTPTKHLFCLYLSPPNISKQSPQRPWLTRHGSASFGIAGSTQPGLAFGEHLMVWIYSILESARKERSLKSTEGANLPLKNIIVVGLIGF